MLSHGGSAILNFFANYGSHDKELKISSTKKKRFFCHVA